MAKITWNTDVNAPCCPGEIVAEDGRTWLIQTDTDFPGVARTLGFALRDLQACPECGQVVRVDSAADEPAECPDHGGFASCDHAGTDGTVDCECGVTAADFISAAREFLSDADGATADDPGYFA